MLLSIVNNTASTITLLSGAISIAGDSTTAVTDTTQQFTLATDGVLREDIVAGNLSVSDGTNTFGSTDAINYLYLLFQALNTQAEGNSGGARQTYSAAVTDLAVATAPTDVFTITGSATKVIRILKLTISGTKTTAGVIDIEVLFRSSANTGGTIVTAVAQPHDSNNAAATAVVRGYTANPTLGTSVSAYKAVKLLVNTALLLPDRLDWYFGDNSDQGIVLRGTSQVFALNFETQTMAGNSFDITITWTEE